MMMIIMKMTQINQMMVPLGMTESLMTTTMPSRIMYPSDSLLASATPSLLMI